MHNQEIAWTFREVATLLELKGENHFRAEAYRKGADVLESLTQPVNEILQPIPGLGIGLLQSAQQLEEKGTLELLEHLHAEITPGIRQALVLPGVGIKVAQKLAKNLKINTLDDLEKAAKEKKIRNIPGLGPKLEVNIQRGIARLRERRGKVLLDEATLLAIGLRDTLLKLGVAQAEVAGQVRRGVEMVDTITLVADPGQVEVKVLQEVLSAHPWLTGSLRVLEDGRQLKGEFKTGLHLEIGLAEESEFLPALVYHTGSSAHVAKLQNLASERELILKHTTLTKKTGERLELQDEHDFYTSLGLSYIVPELREDRGEIVAARVEVEAAQEQGLPDLITRGDIKGDLHLHSSWSDGTSTIPQLAEQAQALGYEYIAVTDHSRSLAIARGLPEAKLLRQHEEIAALNLEFQNTLQDGFKVLTGIEMDILADGRLDYGDELLEGVDLVIASIHSGFSQTGEKLTNRILGAIANPHVDIVAHPTGRVLGRRDPYQVDMQQVWEAAAKYQTVLELNSTPDRLDLKDEHCRMAKKYGIKVAINTDAHDAGAMDTIKYGITTARRGWLEKPDVINAWPLSSLEEFLQS